MENTSDQRCPFCGTQLSADKCPNCSLVRETVPTPLSTEKSERTTGGMPRRAGLYIPHGEDGWFIKGTTLVAVAVSAVLLFGLFLFICFMDLLFLKLSFNSFSNGPALLGMILIIPVILLCALMVLLVAGLAALVKHKGSLGERVQPETTSREEETLFSE